MASIISIGEKITGRSYPDNSVGQEMAEWWREAVVFAVPRSIGILALGAVDKVRDFFEDASDPRSQIDYTETRGEE